MSHFDGVLKRWWQRFPRYTNVAKSIQILSGRPKWHDTAPAMAQASISGMTGFPVALKQLHFLLTSNINHASGEPWRLLSIAGRVLYTAIVQPSLDLCFSEVWVLYCQLVRSGRNCRPRAF
jgi:hypothetical protein